MKNITSNSRRSDATAIWQAGVQAVASEPLVRRQLQLTETDLVIANQSIPLHSLGKILIVGAGKAGAGMAAGIEAALPSEFVQERVHGWVNVPTDCLPEIPLQKIHLHPARPAGINEPTEEGVEGTHQIIKLMSDMSPDDVCIVLISGGGSALLPGVKAPIRLQDKLEITRGLSRAGATIDELNQVRRCLSQVKGGRLLGYCQGRRLISLIISDVVGDPLETIASGPTVPIPVQPEQAINILKYYLPDVVPPHVFESIKASRPISVPPHLHYMNRIIGSNAIALNAAGNHAEELGYRVLSLGSQNIGVARELGAALYHQAIEYHLADGIPICLLCGGETVVPMEAGMKPGRGGRNQEVALGALAAWLEANRQSQYRTDNSITLLAAGTDGEDGPTDAAGAIVDAYSVSLIQQEGWNVEQALATHDAYPLLKQCDSLLITGPTHTNVMDLAVVLIHPS